MTRYLLIFALFLQAICLSSCSSVKRLTGLGDNSVCVVYVSGSGCPNCGTASQVLLKEFLKKYPNLVILEYEIYTDKDFNKPVSDQYFKNYSLDGRRGVPFLVLNKSHIAIGKTDVIALEKDIRQMSSNECPLPAGASESFKNLNLINISGKVRVWVRDRILISDGTSTGDNKILHKLLTARDLKRTLSLIDFKRVTPVPIVISGGQIDFQHAVQFEGWRFQWNGEPD